MGEAGVQPPDKGLVLPTSLALPTGLVPCSDPEDPRMGAATDAVATAAWAALSPRRPQHGHSGSKRRGYGSGSHISPRSPGDGRWGPAGQRRRVVLPHQPSPTIVAVGPYSANNPDDTCAPAAPAPSDQRNSPPRKKGAGGRPHRVNPQKKNHRRPQPSKRWTQAQPSLEGLGRHRNPLRHATFVVPQHPAAGGHPAGPGRRRAAQIPQGGGPSQQRPVGQKTAGSGGGRV